MSNACVRISAEDLARKRRAGPGMQQPGIAPLGIIDYNTILFAQVQLFLCIKFFRDIVQDACCGGDFGVFAGVNPVSVKGAGNGRVRIEIVKRYTDGSAEEG